ncbi:MAG: hypothetical protein ACI85Z_001455, partial [Rheinheimera aquimaris]
QSFAGPFLRKIELTVCICIFQVLTRKIALFTRLIRGKYGSSKTGGLALHTLWNLDAMLYWTYDETLDSRESP